MKNINKLAVHALVLFLLPLTLLNSLCAEETGLISPQNKNKTGEAKQNKDKKKHSFGSINRMQYRYAADGEHAFSQGAFIILPYGFNIAEIAEFYTDTDDNDPMGFKHFTLEAKLARYLNPKNENWGKAFSWVGRFQAASDLDPRWSLGLQWNTRDTPFFRDIGKKVAWKMLFQAFVRERDDDGAIDLFHWYQFPLIKSNKIYLHGVNNWYIDSGDTDYYNLTQDIIFVLTERIDFTLRHSYSSRKFLSYSDGSKISIGLRFAH